MNLKTETGVTKWNEKMIERAKSIVRKGEPLHPVLFLKKGGDIGVIPLGRFSQDKEVLSTLLRAVVGAVNPDEYLYLTEAYMKEIDTKDASDSALGSLLVGGTLQVSQLPSAQEAITALYGDRKGEKLGVIVFRKRGKVVKFEPTRWLEGDELRGRFTGLRGRESEIPPESSYETDL